MTANWFEAKVKYMKVNEDGREKKVNEAYLLDAMSYTEAESRIMHEMESVISGDYYISSLKKSNITELVPSEDENDDRWYKAKVNIIDADEVSGKEKSTGQYYLPFPRSLMTAKAFPFTLIVSMRTPPHILPYYFITAKVWVQVLNSLCVMNKC